MAQAKTLSKAELKQLFDVTNSCTWCYIVKHKLKKRGNNMENLTTPKAILFRLGLIALAIATVPYSSILIKDTNASNILKEV